MDSARKNKKVFKEGWFLFTGSFTLQHTEGEGSRKSGFQRGVVLVQRFIYIYRNIQTGKVQGKVVFKVARFLFKDSFILQHTEGEGSGKSGFQ